MNRILFVGMCLVGLMVFTLIEADTKIKEQPKSKVASYTHVPYIK